MAAKKQTKSHKSPYQKDALGFINIPSSPSKTAQEYERVACVFQGGGALGAYQVGAYHAIHERGYRPNFFAGVSIGAINSSIIAGNDHADQINKLDEFWDTIAPKAWKDPILCDYSDTVRNFHNHMGALQALMFGLDGFFEPRLMPPLFYTESTPDNLSYYDTCELRTTLEKLIDFDRINSKEVTLCLGAVDIASGEMTFFNNQSEEITPDHIMASCALPPAFPAVKLGDKYFWDGGIYANTPLVTVLDALPEENTLCFVIDCFSLKGELPKTMDDVEERQKDIRYASHSRRLTNIYTSRQNLQVAITVLGYHLTPEAKKNPAIQELIELGHEKRFSVVHMINKGNAFNHSFKDYNFVRTAINRRRETGYKEANAVLDKPDWEKKSTRKLACSIYGVPLNYFDQK